jgi:hypothetical protein
MALNPLGSVPVFSKINSFRLQKPNKCYVRASIIGPGEVEHTSILTDFNNNTSYILAVCGLWIMKTDLYFPGF